MQNTVTPTTTTTVDTTATVILKLRLAKTILLYKAKQAGLAYNVNLHLQALYSNNNLPCNIALQQASNANLLYNFDPKTFLNLPITHKNLFMCFSNLNLNKHYCVAQTPQPNLNYLYA